jgi:hypothetical protein
MNIMDLWYILQNTHDIAVVMSDMAIVLPVQWTLKVCWKYSPILTSENPFLPHEETI